MDNFTAVMTHCQERGKCIKCCKLKPNSVHTDNRNIITWSCWSWPLVTVSVEMPICTSNREFYNGATRNKENHPSCFPIFSRTYYYTLYCTQPKRPIPFIGFLKSQTTPCSWSQWMRVKKPLLSVIGIETERQKIVEEAYVEEPLEYRKQFVSYQ